MTASAREMPRLHTERLLLRPFDPADAPRVERLAGAREVADTTLHIPHPYPEGGGATWIATHAEGWAKHGQLTLAICERTAPGDMIGAISIGVSWAHSHGELGYWIAREHWSRGFATEDARALVAYAFDELGLHRVQAHHFTRNPASGRVMQKIGMRPEGVHRDAYVRWGRFEDIAVYGLLASDRRASI